MKVGGAEWPRKAGRQADREIDSGAGQGEAVVDRRDREEDSGVGGGGDE